MTHRMMVGLIIIGLIFNFSLPAYSYDYWQSSLQLNYQSGIHLTEEEKDGIREEKSPAIGAILSFFIPGLGQVYGAEYAKGSAIMGGAALLLGSYLYIDSIRPKDEVNGRFETVMLIMQLGGVGFWLWNFTDAYKIIDTQNKEETEPAKEKETETK